MEPIPGLPMPDDIDGDYSPQYVKLARLLRDQITVGELPHSTRLPAIALAARHQVSGTVALHALEMLDANHYVSRSGRSGSYCVTWQATPEDNAAESRELSRTAVQGLTI